MLYGMSDTAQRQYVAGPMPSFPGLEQPLTDGVVSVRLSAERDIPEVLIAYQDDRGLHLALGEDRPPSGAALGRRADLTVWVAPALRRQGVGGAAHNLVRDWLRQECGLTGECPAQAEDGV